MLLTRGRRARALLLTLLLLPVVAIVAAPPAAAASWWSEDWENSPWRWTFSGPFAARECGTGGYTGYCSLRLAPPCVTGTIVSTAKAALPERTVSGEAFSFYFKTPSTAGETEVWLDLPLADLSGLDAGSLRVHLTQGTNPYNSGVQIVSSGYPSSTVATLYQANRWWLAAVRIEPPTGRAWVEIMDPATGNLAAWTSQVYTAVNAHATSVTFSAQTLPNAGACTAQDFWIDRLRYGDSLPDAPWSLTATSTRGAISLSWPMPDPGAAPIQRYQVYRSVNGSSEFFLANATTASFTDSSLPQGAAAVYRVRAVNRYGAGGMSPFALASTWGVQETWEAGTARWGLVGARAEKDCQMGWSGCSLLLTPDQGGVTLTRTLNQVMTSRFQAAFHYQVSSGESATDARFSVGFDGASVSGSTVTLHLTDGVGGRDLRMEGYGASASVPYAPAAGAWTRVAVLVDPQSDLAWAEVRDAQDDVLARSGPIAIPSGVTMAKTIAFASSTTGPYPSKVHVDSLVTGYLAGAPTGLDGVGGTGQVALRWTAPTELGSGALVGYRLHRGAAGAPLAPVAALGLATSHVDAGLAVDTTYEYAIAAVTTAGEGGAGASKTLRTDRFADDLEGGLGAWTLTDPASATHDCAAARAGACSLRVDPATRGTAVEVTRPLQGVPAGTVTVSAWLQADATQAATDATLALAFTQGQSLQLEFLRASASQSNAWRFRYDSAAGSGWSTQQAWTPAGAWHHASVSFDPDRLQAKGELRDAQGGIVGSSTFTLPSAFWTSGTELSHLGLTVKHAQTGTTTAVRMDDVRVHDAPQAWPVAAFAKKDGGVSLSWAGYPATQPTALTGFRVYAAAQGSPMRAVAALGAGEASHVVRALADGTALVNGQTYCVTVAPLSAFGEGLAAQHGCIVPQALPDAPTELLATPGVNQVSMTWKEGEFDGDPLATQYCVFRGAAGTARSELACVPYSQRAYTDTSVVGGISYTYSVKAKNAAGYSPESNVAQATPQII